MINKFRFDSTVNLKRHQVILRLTVIIIAFGIVGHADYEDAERQHGEYCEMVKLWEQTEVKVLMQTASFSTNCYTYGD